MKTIEELMRLTFEILDKIDVLSLIEEDKEIEVRGFMDKLSTLLKPEVDKYPELEGCLFNMVSSVDFIDYLKKRYKEKLYDREKIIYYITKRK